MSEGKELYTKEQGEMDLELKLIDGKVRLDLNYDGKGANAGVFVELEPEYFLEKLKNLIPGKIDDTIIDMLAVAIKMQS